MDAKHRVRAGQGQHRHAAILNCDIRGFTRLSNRVEPDALICLLADYQARVFPIIHRHGGSIDKFPGDGILATFGTAVPSETYAADALRACEETMEAAEGWNARLAAEGKPMLPLGAAAGPIIFGAVSMRDQHEFFIRKTTIQLVGHNKPISSQPA